MSSFQEILGYTTTVKRYIKNNQHLRIIKIQVGRYPLPNFIQKIVKGISVAGSWEEFQKTTGYDRLYHLFTVLTLETGKVVEIAKFENIEVRDYNEIFSKDVEYIDINRESRNLTL